MAILIIRALSSTVSSFQPRLAAPSMHYNIGDHVEVKGVIRKGPPNSAGGNAWVVKNDNTENQRFGVQYIDYRHGSPNVRASRMRIVD
jgi:hypothetical protein